ncbi:MAG: hypothetical protein CMK74_03875 [Pseudomonadales bacterium]|nr:hypothetical protein [Pseudomonadales bacterium]|tara:strand:+ start:1299 stop:1667 length:369 start_codon:yes stop_codon:yes gene_type:complete
MLTEQAYQSLKAALIVELEKFGWTAASKDDIELTYILATKDYETAVGTRTASVGLINGSVIRLVSSYESRGNNVLSTTGWFDVPTDTSQEEYAKGIESFSSKADEEINASYARRLYLGSAEA